MIANTPKLCFRHECLNSGCRIHDCVLCKYCQRKRCEKPSGFSEKYLANGDVIEARCGASIRAEVIDPLKGENLQDASEFTLRICILDGSKYEKLESDQKTDIEAISSCALLLNNKGQPLLSPGKAARWDDEKRVLVTVTGGSVLLPDLKVTDSSEAMLGGKQPNFYLLLEPVKDDGTPAEVEYLVSEGFVVATQRTKPYIKVEIPHVDDHVSKVNSIGAQTQKKLEDLRAAASAANVPDLNVPFNSITKVGQLKELVEMAERNKPLRENLKQVLRLTKGWDSVRDHVMMAVDTDRRLRVWYADDNSDLGLVFQCTTYNVVDLQNPVGVLRRKRDSTYADIFWSTKSGPEAELIVKMLPHASECWWKSGHPSWHLLPENLVPPDWETINTADQCPISAVQIARPNEPSYNYGHPGPAPPAQSSHQLFQREAAAARMPHYDMQPPQAMGMRPRQQYQGVHPGGYQQVPVGRHRVVTSGQHSQQAMAEAMYQGYDHYQFPANHAEQQQQPQPYRDSNSFERMRMQQGAQMERAHLFNTNNMSNPGSMGQMSRQAAQHAQWAQFQNIKRPTTNREEEQATYDAHMRAQLRANGSASGEIPLDRFQQNMCNGPAGPSGYYDNPVSSSNYPRSSDPFYMPNRQGNPQGGNAPSASVAHQQQRHGSSNGLPDNHSMSLQEQFMQQRMHQEQAARRAEGASMGREQGQAGGWMGSQADHQQDSLPGNSSSLRAHRNLMQQQLLFEQQQAALQRPAAGQTAARQQQAALQRPAAGQTAAAAARQQQPHWRGANNVAEQGSMERVSLKRERSIGVDELQTQPSSTDSQGNMPLASPFESPDVQNVMRMLVAQQPKAEPKQKATGPVVKSQAQANQQPEVLKDSLTRWRDASTQQQVQHPGLSHLPDPDAPINMSISSSALQSFLSNFLEVAGNDPSMTDGRGEFNSQALMEHFKRLEAQRDAGGLQEHDPMSASGPLPTVSSDFMHTVLSMLKQGESLDHVVSVLQESAADLANGMPGMSSWLPPIDSWPFNRSGFQQDGPTTSGLENMQSVEEALPIIHDK